MGVEWRDRLGKVIEILGSLTPEAFYDEATLRYHPVERDINALLRAFEVDHREMIRRLFDRTPRPRETWLPDTVTELAEMDVSEIYWRLREQSSDERWVDGALLEPFIAGVLTAALKRILADIERLTPVARP